MDFLILIYIDHSWEVLCLVSVLFGDFYFETVTVRWRQLY